MRFTIATLALFLAAFVAANPVPEAEAEAAVEARQADTCYATYKDKAACEAHCGFGVCKPTGTLNKYQCKC